MLKTMFGLLVGLLIGAGCRWFEVPLPSPPKLLGALLVVAMTVGYIGIDRILAAKSVADVETGHDAQSVRTVLPYAKELRP